jgi:hypothetical protein
VLLRPRARRRLAGGAQWCVEQGRGHVLAPAAREEHCGWHLHGRHLEASASTQKESERRPCIESGDPNAVLAIGRQVGNSDGEGGASGVGEGGVSEVGKSKGGGGAHGERVLRAGSQLFLPCTR